LESLISDEDDHPAWGTANKKVKAAAVKNADRKVERNDTCFIKVPFLQR
jgi:hypothetical protein